MKKLPLIFAIVLYLLIYFLRSQQAQPAGGQGGWDLKIDLFKTTREALDQKISRFLPSPQAELLSGILLGQNKNLPGSLKLALRDSSTLHIVVASGQNLSMVAGFFMALSGLIKRKYAVTLSLGSVVLYTLLTGLQVPILRAAIMFGFASLAQLFGRKSDGLRVLIITGGLMLLINPAWISSLSFQLSFLATFGVVIVSPVILKYFKTVPLIGQDLAVTLAAQIMVTPVIAQNFHQISLVSLLTNIMVLWTIPFIMIGGILMIFFGTIFYLAGQLLALAVSALLTYFIYIVQFFAHLPFAWEYIGEQAIVVWVGYYLVMAAVMLLLNNAKKEDT